MGQRAWKEIWRGRLVVGIKKSLVYRLPSSTSRSALIASHCCHLR